MKKNKLINKEAVKLSGTLILTLFLIISIFVAGIPLSNADNGGSFAPKFIWGYVTYCTGGAAIGASVTITALDPVTNPIKTGTTDSVGAYSIDVSNDPSGPPWPDGTDFQVTVTISSWSGVNTGILSGLTQCDVTLNPPTLAVNIALNAGWNLISLPINESINKYNITVNYNGGNHTWQEAVTDNIVLNFVYGWNADSQSYLTANVLESGEGYWMYSYDTCMLWMTGNGSGDVVTDLVVKWNLVGLPFDGLIDKGNLTVELLNGTSYTWSEAVVVGFILDFVYGWNVISQSYAVVDELESGGGYWMYAYYPCSLLRPA